MRKYYETGGKNQCSNCVFKYFLNYCQSKRLIINPNEGFKSALISYYKKDWIFKGLNTEKYK